MSHSHRSVKRFRLWFFCYGLLPVILGSFSSVTLAQMNRAEVIQRVEQQSGGRVIAVKATKEQRYRVRVIMPGGRIKHLVIDGNNGVVKRKGKQSDAHTDR